MRKYEGERALKRRENMEGRESMKESEYEGERVNKRG